MLKQFLAALLFATVAGAQQQTTTLVCDDFYPESESPEHTTAIASLQFRPDGSLAGLTCSLAEGDPSETCNIADGACCSCNVTRGFTPECTITVEWTPSKTIGRCVAAFPACYYGNACDSADGAFVLEETKAVTRHDKKHRKPRKARKS